MIFDMIWQIEQNIFELIMLSNHDCWHKASKPKNQNGFFIQYLFMFMFIGFIAGIEK
jgi:hypothetical protein